MNFLPFSFLPIKMLIIFLRVLQVPKKKKLMKQLTTLVGKINLKVLFTPSTIGAVSKIILVLFIC